MASLRKACIEILELLVSIGPQEVPGELFSSFTTVAFSLFFAVDAVDLNDPEIDELLSEQIRALKEHLRWCREMYEEKQALRGAILNRNLELMRIINDKMEGNQEEADR